MYVLDTTVLVELLRGDEATVDAAASLEEQGPLATTCVTVQELVQGAHRSARPKENLRAVWRLLGSLATLGHTTASAERAGEVAATLAGEGTPIGDLDTMIAAIASQSGAAVVTHNQRHFERVPGLAVHPLPE